MCHILSYDWYKSYKNINKKERLKHYFCMYLLKNLLKSYALINLVLRNEYFRYSKVPNKHSTTFINFRKIFQGLSSYLEGVRSLFLTKCFFQVKKVGFKTPNIMKIILFEGGDTLIWGGYAYCFYQIFQGVRLFGGLRLGTLEYISR